MRREHTRHEIQCPSSRGLPSRRCLPAQHHSSLHSLVYRCRAAPSAAPSMRLLYPPTLPWLAFSMSSWVPATSLLTGSSPFLSFVSNREQFDQQLSQYVNSSYVQSKYARSLPYSSFELIAYSRYQQLLGCDNINLSNTTAYYARYTTSVICNSIVQNSIEPCGLSSDQSTPLCADSCVCLLYLAVWSHTR